MKCPVCVEENLSSTLVESGGLRTTLVHYPAFHDKDGNRHVHNANTATAAYRCSNGHTFTVKKIQGSCWCGWPEDAKEEVHLLPAHDGPSQRISLES